ncbi:peptidoglycan DD-metalloendopeptidase family protein [Flavobacterium sp. Fl-77]|uniref:Peptidoglycan DD-metalloendopeptidase family protein n=1 Tax=Flavobacterium flavipigmentatum TaxID=2893884 RepID=A0AAJ2VWN7_9FLAO|nr:MULTISPECIES: peptidoglycan DD-metalloendopeptidase family protein [unclassified Flavobacterium]MDX6180749.1 peptidoglycan DD-metalloendopeptidase family protein [Flavobacterium sp. Fl-33]MDX6184349.1 peptidoglycan DD-metalloendopeptidase family protein [Flavobacterium sp. Fl-77]UFH39458.1 peptidoglycan DD-metalloendopeptidase family protein [Flavobacterium sp. F-70]
MKKVFVIIIVLFSIVSCNKTDQKVAAKISQPKSKKIEFGFNYADFNVVQDTIKKGDSFGTIIQSQNIGDKKVYDIVAQVKDTFDVRSIRYNKPYTILRSKNKTNKLEYFIYQPDALTYYVINLKDSIATCFKKIKPVTLKRKIIGGVLKSSLSETLGNESVEAALANRITKVFSWSIDFFKLKKGDRYGLIFTERFINGKTYDGVEDLQAAFFEYKGKIIYAFPFEKDSLSGKIEYYDDEGKTLKNFFLKTPIKFSRITSRFTMNRFHPVQHRWKAHKGTDYAAPRGTPISTTASGVVEQTGYTAGNGNFVKVKHNGTYSTQYLHMSRILVRRGQRVTQGQKIGLVGSTGLASGPHVCYRFWKNGMQVDALRLNLPTGESLTGNAKERFLKQMEPLKRELDSIGNL